MVVHDKRYLYHYQGDAGMYIYGSVGLQIDAGITWDIPCKWAFLEYMALVSFSTELGDVKMCLNAWN